MGTRMIRIGRDPKIIKEDYPIDIVVTWVDGNDEEWKESCYYWQSKDSKELEHLEDVRDERYRDWDTLRYFFRSIEMYAPWINKVHLVTCGHLPKWINVKAPKLNIVTHSDFMDERYLPTFSSHAIEFNIHRIHNLSDQFIYFNDDTLLVRQANKDDFFKNGLPVDYAALNVLVSTHRFSMMDTALTNIEIINDYFDKNEIIRKNLYKWFNPLYGKEVVRTALLLPFKNISNFSGNHFPHAYLKQTFEEVWDKEGKLLDEVSCRKFRTRRDPNHWLMREWQLASGRFVPGDSNRGIYIVISDNEEELDKAFKRIEKKKPLMVCINDSGKGRVEEFDKTKLYLNNILDRLYPNKSAFEA